MSVDARLSLSGPARWAAVAATQTRCQHCYARIVQPRPEGRWRDTEHECATCTRHIYHQPMPSVSA